jgi:hypothetical protein
MEEENITNKKILIFSMVTGDIYTIEKDELKNMDQQQVPLVKRPSSSCKKCYGRFHAGYNRTTGVYMPCSKCIKKCVDFESLLSEGNKIEKPTT